MKKITSEIFICDNCPEWANYAAVDKNGDGYLFKDSLQFTKIDGWVAELVNTLANLITLIGKNR